MALALNNEMHLLGILSPELKKAATRNGFGEALVEIGEKDESVVALCADVCGSVQIEKFARKFPSRFFQVALQSRTWRRLPQGWHTPAKSPI